MDLRLAAVLTCTAALALAPAAGATIVPGATIGGPSGDIPANNIVQSDAAPDGTAAIAYLKNVGGVAHVFVSRLVGGAWTAPEQVDGAGASSAARIGVANGGKVVVTYVNAAGQLLATVKPNASAPFGAAAPIGAAVSTYGDIDLAPGGNGYVAIGTTNDVFASRLEGTTFTPVAPVR